MDESSRYDGMFDVVVAGEVAANKNNSAAESALGFWKGMKAGWRRRLKIGASRSARLSCVQMTVAVLASDSKFAITCF